MRRALHVCKRVAQGVLLLVLVAVIAALVFIHTDYGRNIIREQVVKALADAVPGGVKIARIDGSVFGTLTIRGVEIDGRDGKPWVTVGAIEVRVSLTSLVRHVVHVDSLALHDIVVDQHPQPPAPPEPPKPEPPKTDEPSEPSPWTIEVADLDIQNASARITSPDRTLDFHDLEIYGRASIDRGAITAIIGTRGKWADRDIAATAIAHYDRGVATVPFAATKVAKAHARVIGLRVGDVLEGSVVAFVPAVTAAAVAQLDLPGDVAFAAGATPDGALEAHGSIGDATLDLVGSTSLETRSASALLVADVPDGAKLFPAAAGHARVTAALSGDAAHVRGMVAIDATRPLAKQLLGKPEVHATALLAVDASLSGAWVLLESGLDAGATRATALAELARDPKTGAVSLTKSTLVASASKLGAAHTDAHVGYLVVNGSASGPLLPKPALKLNAMIDGDSLRYGDLSVASVDAQVDTRHITEANIHLDVGQVRSGATPIASATLDARVARDADGTIDIAIDKHAVTTASNGVWSGTAGRVRIEPTKIVVDDFHTGSGPGSVVANATLDLPTKNLRATVSAKDVALATLAPALAGTLGADVEIERRGTAWKGTGTVTGKDVVVGDRPPMDLGATFEITGRHVDVASTITAPEGKASVAVDLDGPADLTDGRAWKRLERKAIRDVTIAVDHMDLAKVGATGTVAGKLEITATGASGDLALRGFATSHGTVDADLTLAPDAKGVRGVLAQLKAQVEGVDAATADVWLDLPARPFDPAQWTSLGKGALHHATVTLAPLDFDPGVLAKANIDKPFRGHVAATIDVTEGLGAIAARVDVTELRGGALVQPVDVHVRAYLDEKGARVTTIADLASRGNLIGKQMRAAGVLPRVFVPAPELVEIEAGAPIKLGSLAEMKRALASIATTPLDGKITFPQVAASEIVAVLGRRDVTSGVVDGEIDLAGTLAKPTAEAEITVHDVTIPPSIAGRAPAKLSWLQIAGTWDGTAGELAISGKEVSGGTLAIAAGGRRDKLGDMTATFSAKQFDIAPVTAFAVGAFSAARGTLDANLALVGFDPDTGTVSGTIDIAGGRLPISPLLGTLRETKAHVEIKDHKVDAKVGAKLGKGSLDATANVALNGSTPAKATAKLTLKDISLVRAFQPTINGVVDADFSHGPTGWDGTLKVTHSHVAITTTGGVALLPSDPPSDMDFTDQAPAKLVPLLQRPPPEKPWLRATVELAGTGFEVSQDEFQIRGNVAGNVKLSLGGGVGMEGALEATTQNIEILGTRAQLDHASITWDGTLDPVLDVEIERDMTELTVTAMVRGRLSKPQIQLSSDSGSYSQGELIGYFLGGTPSADRGDVSQTAAAAGAGAASALVTSQVRKLLPGAAAKYAQRISLNYEVATASSSEALRLGYWVSPHVFVAVHSHLEPLPDENANEGIGEWHFRANMMLQGNAGDRGIAGLDLVRRWRW